jgi:hypothetical protein
MKEKLISRFLAPHNSPVRKIRLHLERENILVLNVSSTRCVHLIQEFYRDDIYH